MPDVLDDNDPCVLQLISDLKDVDRIEPIYVIPDIDGVKAQFCFRYDPSLISSDKVLERARQEQKSETEFESLN